MTTTPADEMRAAAQLLREAAGRATPGPWRTHDTHLGSVGGHTATVLTDRENINDTELIAWLPTMSSTPWDEARNAWRNAGWMALMDPEVGLAVADWLDAEARGFEAVTHLAELNEGHIEVSVETAPDGRPCYAYSARQYALTVARRVLGETTTDTGAQAAAPLKSTEREFLRYALDLAADRMASRDGFTDEDHAALARLRRLADEAQQPTPAPAEETK